jgi:Undecaprenyl-phosphate glucose phosphotransferase
MALYGLTQDGVISTVRSYVSSASRRRDAAPISPDQLAGLALTLDFCLLVLATIIEVAICAWAQPAHVTTRNEILVALAGSGVAIALNMACGVYSVPQLRQLRAQLPSLALSLGTGGIGVAVGVHVFSTGNGSGVFSGSIWILAAASLLLGAHYLQGVVVRGWIAAGIVARRIAIVGSNAASSLIMDQMARDPNSLARVVGIYDDAPSFVWSRGMAPPPISGTLQDLVSRTRVETLDAIVIVPDAVNPEASESALAQLRSVVGDIFVVSDTPSHGATRFGQAIGVKIAQAPLSSLEAARKLVFDYVVASAMLVLLGPLLVLTALLIKLDSRGPVLFRQTRIGYNNVPFQVLKFRTMHHHLADHLADRQTCRGDKRITRVGKWLRRLSIDELPNLFNVLRGEMSVIGPRPHAPNTKAAGVLFADAVPDYAARHRIKPGITGWAQVNGWRGETRTIAQLEQRVQHDLHYIAAWSTWLDVKILLLTVSREIFSKQAF